MSLTEYASATGTALDETSNTDEQFAHVALNVIVASRTNPRKMFDQVKLQELADSIKATGVHQPILLRPLPADRLAETSQTKGPRPTHEVVAGERRYRASLLAAQTTIPAMVRRLTDDQAIEIQIIENLHRTDLSAFEEAEGFEHLMQHSALTAKQVGEKISKSKEFVYARLKLLDLFQAGRQALREGKLDTSKALLLARIPNEKLQNKALGEIMSTNNYDRAPMSAVAAAEHVRRNYMLQLSQARFKITNADLVPAAGSCKDCTKRTGYAPELFADVKGADMCTDPTCFHKKEEAESALVVEQAKGKGLTVIAGNEAKELVTGGYNAKYKGYRRLDLAEDSPTDQPLRKIIGTQMKAEGIDPVMIEHHQKRGELVAALPNEVVLRLLKAVESQAHAVTKAGTSPTSTTKSLAKEVKQFADEKKAKAEAKAKEQYEHAWRKALLERAWDTMTDRKFIKPVFTLDVHRFIVLKEVSRLSTSEAEAIGELLGLGKVGAHSALIEFARETINPDYLQLLIIMQRDSGAHDYSYENDERLPNVGLMLVAGKVLGDELDLVTNEVQRDMKAKFFPSTVEKHKGRVKSSSVEAEKPDLPLPSAALAVDSRAKQKKSNTPAAPGGDSPTRKRKATAQETKEGIAHALQGLEAAAATAAGSTDTEQTPANAATETTPGSATALQGDEASALADAWATGKVAWPFPTEPAPPTPPPTTSGTISTAAPADKFDDSAWPFPKENPGASDQTALVRAKALVIREKKATVRLLKAELGIGTTLAMGIMTELENLGVVSACDERGARKVLVAA